MLITHAITATGVNDASKQVSVDAWNDDHVITGLFDAPIIGTLTLAQAQGYAGWTAGALCYVAERAAVFQYKSSRQLLAGEAVSVLTYSDELHILTDDGGLLEFYDLAQLKARESDNYARFNAKLRSRSAQIVINCLGDSMTYGQAQADTPASTNRVGQATGFGDGSTYEHWQYNACYAQVLSQQLIEVLAGSAAVVNSGYSGDRTLSSYLRHITPVTADISTVMLGVNDTLYGTANGSTPTGLTTGLYSVASYAIMLRKTIAREILRGKCVIVLGNIYFGSLNGYDGGNLSSTKLATAYNDAAQSVAQEFGCAYIDVRQDMLKQFSLLDITQEGTHLNEVGHNIIGTKLAAVIMHGGYKLPFYVNVGSAVSTNELFSRIQSTSNLEVLTLPSETGAPLATDTNNIATIQLKPNIPVVIPFYAECDGLVMFPSVYQTSPTTVVAMLDGGVSPKFLLGDGQSAPLVIKTTSKTIPLNFKTQNINVVGDFHVHAVARGWHHLKITNTSGNGNCFLESVLFLSNNDMVERARDYGLSATLYAVPDPYVVTYQANLQISRANPGLYAGVFYDSALDPAKYSITVDFEGAGEYLWFASNRTSAGFSLRVTTAAGVLIDPPKMLIKVLGGR